MISHWSYGEYGDYALDHHLHHTSFNDESIDQY